MEALCLLNRAQSFVQRCATSYITRSNRRHCQPYRCSSPVDAARSCLRFLPPAQHARDFYGKVDSHPSLPAPRSVMYLSPGHSQPRPWLSAVPEQKTGERAAGIKTTTRNKRAGKERATRREVACSDVQSSDASNAVIGGMVTVKAARKGMGAAGGGVPK